MHPRQHPGILPHESSMHPRILMKRTRNQHQKLMTSNKSTAAEATILDRIVAGGWASGEGTYGGEARSLSFWSKIFTS